MITLTHIIIILLMAITTYLSRITGYLVLRKRELSTKQLMILNCIPGCVLLSVIAPVFVSEEPAVIFALVVTLIAVTRLSLLPTVLIAMMSAGLFRYFLS